MAGGDPRAGDLLIATPVIEGPEFARSIVLLLNVDDDGALGVVLNRPTPVEVAGVLDAWEGLVSEPAVVFQGGPVEPEGALAVARLRPGVEAPNGWRPLYDRTGLVDLDLPVADAYDAVRVYAGYAGWGAAQLRAELAEGAWTKVVSHPDDLVAVDPEDLWRRVLRRQSSPTSWQLTMPVDPTVN